MVTRFISVIYLHWGLESTCPPAILKSFPGQQKEAWKVPYHKTHILVRWEATGSAPFHVLRTGFEKYDPMLDGWAQSILFWNNPYMKSLFQNPNSL